MDKYTNKICKHHGEQRFILEGRGYYRCTKCRMDAVKRKRINLKTKLVEHFGGKCKICGYDKYQGSLQFHHLDPNEKDFGLSVTGNTYSFEKLVKEANKCLLVCANCHGEVHAGITNIPE